ncbi:MAG: hypothetical protein AUI16_02525 [Alphaproteobacteria bacterium 13_2_20CM_2_64_7]|jgi:hypothetical protein|nr:MAG: hypothetical protein AUI16_02525 [Alphaproteobacteria bacterium 13_2_20CM_2_64_7]
MTEYFVSIHEQANAQDLVCESKSAITNLIGDNAISPEEMLRIAACTQTRQAGLTIALPSQSTCLMKKATQKGSTMSPANGSTIGTITVLSIVWMRLCGLHQVS